MTQVGKRGHCSVFSCLQAVPVEQRLSFGNLRNTRHRKLQRGQKDIKVL